MRLPWGSLPNIESKFLRDREIVLVGCVSFEERCRAVPEFLSDCKSIHLVEVTDPPDAFPDYSFEIGERTNLNWESIDKAGISFVKHAGDLVVTEDRLLDILSDFGRSITTKDTTVVLDITAFPKRYFCFLIKRLVNQSTFRNVVVTYTEPGPNGYTSKHLAEDPRSCEALPGYSSLPTSTETTLVVSVGFESLIIKPLLEGYAGEKKRIKMLLAFPPNGINNRRQWNTLRQVVSDTQEIQGNTEVIAAWDAEQVYRTLQQWAEDSDGLTLAPFGPKPHTLGMALFAVHHDSGLYYTQPKSYHPDYSHGRGTTWAYVVKWDGTPCFKRHVNMP
jgi:hypothetical protein